MQVANVEGSSGSKDPLGIVYGSTYTERMWNSTTVSSHIGRDIKQHYTKIHSRTQTLSQTSSLFKSRPEHLFSQRNI